MSRTVDSKVVELKFDASRFKKQTEIASEQLKSLEKDAEKLDKTWKQLSKDLHLEELPKAAKKAKQGVEKVTEKVDSARKTLKKWDDGLNAFLEKHHLLKVEKDADSLKKSLDGAGRSFSALETIATGALLTIGNKIANVGTKLVSGIISPITSGGLQRARNIEQASFQFEGMNMRKSEGNEDKGYYEEVMQAVLGTAYSYDVAAKAASQLAASNIGVKKSMKTLADGSKIETMTMNKSMTDALLGIAGVASMTGSSFEDISQIFTRVAGQGRVMANDLNSISARGLNAAAVLGASMGKTEKEIRDMVSKGKVSFADFSKAMSTAYGTHAKDSTKMFTGALEDVKAALSRIGADFFAPYLTAARDVLNSITPLVDVIHTLLQPTIDSLGLTMKRASKHMSQFFDMLSFGLVDDQVSWAEENYKRFANILDRFKAGQADVRMWFEDQSMWMEGFYSEGYEGKVKIDFTQMMTDYLSVDKDKLKKLIDSGEIGLVEVYDALNDLILKSPELMKASNEDFRTAATMYMKDTFSMYSKVIDFFDNQNVDNRPMSAWEAETYSKMKHTLEILKRIRAIATGIKDIFKALKSIFTSVLKLVGKLLIALSPVFEFVVEIIVKIAETIDHLFQAISAAESVNSIFGKIERVLVALGKEIRSWNIFENIVHAIGFALKGVEKVAYSLYEGFKKLFEILSHLAEKFIDNLGDIFNSIANILKALSLGGFFVIFSMLGKLEKALSGPTKSLKSFANSIKKLGKDVFDTFHSFASVAKELAKGLKALTGVLKEMQQVLKSTQILLIAGAIFVLAGAFYVLSKIKISKATDLIGPLVGIFATMGALFIVVEMVSKLAEKTEKLKIFKDLGSLAKAFYSLAIGTAILAAALWVLSTVDTAKLIPAFIVIEIMLATLIGAMALLTYETDNNWLGLPKKSKQITKGVMGLIAMSVAVLILAKALKKLDGIDSDTLAMDFLVIEGLLGSLFVFTKEMSKFQAKKFMGAALSMVAVGWAISSLTKSIGKLSKLNTDQIGTGLLAIVTMLGAVVVACQQLKGQHSIMGAVSILIMAEALKILTKVIKEVSAMDPDQFVTSLAMLGTALLVMGIALKLLNGTNPLMAAVSMVVMAEAIKMISGTLMTLGEADLITLAKGVGSIVAVILILAAACVAFDKIKTTGILKFIGTLVGLSLSVMLFGAALIVMGLGLNAMGSGLQSLAKAGENFENLIFVLGALATALAGISAVGIGAALPIIVFAAAMLLLGVAVKKIGMGFEMMMEAINTLTHMDVGELKESTSTIMTSIKSLKAIKKIAPDITAATDEIKTSIDNLAEVTKTATSNVKSLTSAGSNIISGITKGVNNSKSTFKEALTTMVTEGLNAIKEKKKSFESVGKDLVQGLINGMNSKIPAVKKVSKSIASAAEEALRKASQTRSPSRVWMRIGGYWGDGLTLGINGSQASVSMAGENLANTAMASLNRVGDLLNSDVDMSPRIRPVMDLSDVTSGVGSMNRMLNGDYTASMTASISGVSSSQAIAKEMQAAIQNGEANYTFNIPLEVDGRNIARATVSYTQDELNKLTTRTNRRYGIV